MKTITTAWTSLGGDPELAITNGDGALVPAKSALSSLPTATKSVEIDGLFAELHPSPDTCRERLANRYRDCLLTLWQHANGDLSEKSVIDVPQEILEQSAEDEVELGCEPDYDAYSGSKNTIDIEPRKLKVRTGGGHIHFGFNVSDGTKKALFLRNGKWYLHDTYEEAAPDIIKTMDYLCGVPCILMDTGAGPRERRKVYGKAGAYRIQKHGIEYRTLSNFWLWHASLMSAVYLLGRIALIVATEYPILMETLFNMVPNEDIQQIINENNEEAAAELTLKFKPIIHEITDYKIISFLFAVNKIGKETLFKGSYCVNWGLNNRSIGSYNRHREWWGEGVPGLESFISLMPTEIKRQYNQIVQEVGK